MMCMVALRWMVCKLLFLARPATAIRALDIWLLHRCAAWNLEETADGTSERAVALDQAWYSKNHHQHRLNLRLVNPNIQLSSPCKSEL